MVAIRVCLLPIILTFKLCNSAKILAIVPSPSYSHQVVFHALWRELSLRGHQVTTLTTDIINDSSLVNLTEIDLKFSYDTLKDYRDEILYSKFPKSIYVMYSLLIKVCEPQLRHTHVQALIKNPHEHFDLVIVEAGRWPFIAFAERFQCPLITIGSTRFPNAIYDLLGNPVHSTIYPDFMVVGEASLWRRIYSFIYDAIMVIYWRTSLMRLSQSITDKHFGTNYSNLDNILKNTSLNLVNTDNVFYDSMPMLPNIINIGGMPRRISLDLLPKELQEVLDTAVDGFVYFSLGSNVRSEELSQHTIDVIVKTFAELPYLILWKFDGFIEHKPHNVITHKWLPQASVLNHPNIKLFITQGGAQSLDEAKDAKVPVIGVPFFGDQKYNVLNIVKRSLGLSVDYNNLNKETLKSTILEVIKNPIYKRNMEKLSNLVLDQPMNGLERAVWWIEFVIRHKGASHLRSPFLDVPRHQYYQIDVLAVLCAFLLILLSTIFIVAKVLVNTICSKQIEKIKKQ